MLCFCSTFQLLLSLCTHGEGEGSKNVADVGMYVISCIYMLECSQRKKKTDGVKLKACKTDIVPHTVCGTMGYHCVCERRT